MGDPIETRALGEVLCEGRPEGEHCIIGSVKSNVGHLESGSGIAGVIKAALVLHHKLVPKNLNFETPNPNIPFEEMKLKVPRENMPLPRKGDVPPGRGGELVRLRRDELPHRAGGSSWR